MNPVHYLSEQAKGAVDIVAITLGGIAVISFLQTIALLVTIAAGIGSLSLVVLRWHDRMKYGPAKGRE